MATVTIPTFTGVKAAGASIPRPIAAVAARTPKLAPKLKIKAASLKQVLGGAVIAAAAGALLAGNVLAAEVKLGGDDGELAFIPSEIKVAPGETIVFKNNKAFPHNVIFDEDEVPTGVDVSKISMSEEKLLNGPGDEFTVTLTEKGTYSYYCSPHLGVGMAGKIIVE